MKRSRPTRRPPAKRASVTFDAQDYAEMETLAKQKKVSVSWLVREAVSLYLVDRAALSRTGSGKDTK